MKKSIIVAVDQEWGFGKDGKIPWHSPEDFKFFKTTTQDSVCIMGRNTYDDMVKVTKGKMLPNREVIVVTSRPGVINECPSTLDVREAVSLAQERFPNKNVFFCGGEGIYRDSLRYADSAYITFVGHSYNCDKFFPKEEFLKRFEFERETGDILCPKLNKYLKFVQFRKKYEAIRDTNGI